MYQRTSQVLVHSQARSSEWRVRRCCFEMSWYYGSDSGYYSDEYGEDYYDEYDDDHPKAVARPDKRNKGRPALRRSASYAPALPG